MKYPKTKGKGQKWLEIIQENVWNELTNKEQETIIQTALKIQITARQPIIELKNIKFTKQGT